MPRRWNDGMLVVKFSLVASAAMLCALFAIAPMFDQLRTTESAQSVVNADTLRAMATRGAIHSNFASGQQGD
jgi:hypothetical protein